jgi:hypothetical protein
MAKEHAASLSLTREKPPTFVATSGGRREVGACVVRLGGLPPACETLRSRGLSLSIALPCNAAASSALWTLIFIAKMSYHLDRIRHAV